MTDPQLSVVFDCNAYLQAMTSGTGPAAECLRHLEAGAFDLWLSDAVLRELRDLPGKPGVRRLSVSPDFVERFINTLVPLCRMIASPPLVFTHPIDPKDSCYVDLAVAANAKLIVSRDNHLLNLTNPAKPWSADFRERFPMIEVLTPDVLLTRLRR